ncbi:MAG TPA: 30S ribosomal protein S6 [Polyangiaceae bacterium]|nr:30S ribosomal protein S6 [Polyangiaceae bacterium]
MTVQTPNAPASPHGSARAREYETIYVLRSDVDAETAERVQGRVSDALDREKGKLVKVESWGRRKLAYPIGKQRKGVYVFLKYVGGGGLVAEVERNLKLQEAVVKFMTVQTADAVDIGTLQVDPEETKLGKIELAPEDEKEESREKQLGLVDFGSESKGHHRAPEDADEFVDEPVAGPGEEPPSAKAEDRGEEEK